MMAQLYVFRSLSIYGMVDMIMFVLRCVGPRTLLTSGHHHRHKAATENLDLFTRQIAYFTEI